MMTPEAAAVEAVHPGEEMEYTDTVANQALGFWLYLMTDLILFSALFATFAVLRTNTAGGPAGKDIFDLYHVLEETSLLLVSSASFGLVMVALYNGRKGAVLAGLIATFLLGFGFIFMEVGDFLHLIRISAGPDRSAFLSSFFTLVGTHGTHVTFGLIWILVMIGQVVTKGLTTPVQSRLLRLSMFWHFLDIIWIGIFSVVYLMGVIR